MVDIEEIKETLWEKKELLLGIGLFIILALTSISVQKTYDATINPKYNNFICYNSLENSYYDISQVQDLRKCDVFIKMSKNAIDTKVTEEVEGFVLKLRTLK